MIQSSPFRDLIARHKALALALARDFPEADEETLADTIEGASDLPVLLTAVLRSRLEDLSLVEALRRRLDVMRGRLERLEGRAEQSACWSAPPCRRSASASWWRRSSQLTYVPAPPS